MATRGQGWNGGNDPVSIPGAQGRGARTAAGPDPRRLPVGIRSRWRDPLRTFVFEAADRAVSEVFVDGEAVVADGKPLHLDPEGAGAQLEESQARMLAEAPERDFLGRTAEAITPLSLPP